MQIVFSSSYSLLTCPNHSRTFISIVSCWSEMKITQSCPTVCDPMNYTVHGILQVRILEWVAFPFPRGSSQPRDRTQVSCIADGFFTSWGKAGKGSPCHLSVSPFLAPHHCFCFFCFVFCLYFFFLEICSLAYLPQVPVKYEHHAWTLLIHLLYCLKWQWLLYQCIKLQV